MIGLMADQVKLQYGTQLAYPGGGRYNSKGATRHEDKAYKYEFGYLDNVSIYVIVNKKDGSRIQDLEASAFRSVAGSKDAWELQTKPEPKTDTSPEKIHDATPLDWTYTEKDEKGTITKALYCQHQGMRVQLVIFKPEWRPDLADLAKTRL